jgi:hypothetical protein
MNNIMTRSLLILVVAWFAAGCTWHRHKTFEEKFEYKSGKVIKYIKKVVSDKEKLERIDKKILAYKPKLKSSYESFKKDKEAFKSLLPKVKDKEEVKSKLKTLADKKLDKYNLMVDLMFEIKAELSEEEWNKLAEYYSKKCSHRWK